jgi:hypothetical protein
MTVQRYNGSAWHGYPAGLHKLPLHQITVVNAKLCLWARDRLLLFGTSRKRSQPTKLHDVPASEINKRNLVLLNPPLTSSQSAWVRPSEVHKQRCGPTFCFSVVIDASPHHIRQFNLAVARSQPKSNSTAEHYTLVVPGEAQATGPS